MSMEIEIKAWVDEPSVAEARLRKVYGPPKPVKKEDIYYTTDGKFPSLTTLRLRLSGGRWILTYKDKTLVEGMEINREHETTVADFEVMDELLKRFGCRYWLKKNKRGHLFSAEGLTIELVEVEGLGTFLEVEKVVPGVQADTGAARSEILAVFDLAGVPHDRIESRYYSDMLLNQ